jgi:serine/threonine protein kinase
MTLPQRELSDTYPTIAGYRIGNLMGQGPLGKIYRAVHLQTGEVAIMRGFTRPGNADASSWEAAKNQFRQLLSAHQRVADLPGAPTTLQRILGFGEEGGLFWVASEYFEARPLHQILQDE